VAVCEKLLPGFRELMRRRRSNTCPRHPFAPDGRHPRPHADRQPPRPPEAIRENLEAVFPAIPYCVDLIGGPRLETTKAAMKAFRPETVNFRRWPPTSGRRSERHAGQPRPEVRGPPRSTNRAHSAMQDRMCHSAASTDSGPRM